jgi:hypothetical protein
MDSLDGYVADDELAVKPLRRLGWEVETVSWRDPHVDWDRFDAVIIRTPWDYQDDPEAFLDVLWKIEDSCARLENPLQIVEWNLDKSYLRELGNLGIPIVPTLWSSETLTERAFDEFRTKLDSNELIIKPTVSATAQDTFRLSELIPELECVFHGRSYMVQPFIDSIAIEGEYSLFYFNGEYSHTILKTPRPGDFRVQEEHGGIITAVAPDPSLMAAADKINSSVLPVPLYARVDLVRGADGGLLLMELELIEPALYFRMDEESPERFAQAFDLRMNEL